MKRFLAILLSIVFLLLPFGMIPASAEDFTDDAAAVEAGYYFRVGDTEAKKRFGKFRPNNIK